MKKTAIILLLALSSISAFSQCKKLKKLNAQLENLYQSEEFLLTELIISPEAYNPANDTTISRIEFWQDSLNNLNDVPKVYATISKKDGLNQKYSVGSIYDFQTNKFEITLYFRVYYADGKQEIKTYKEHFDNLEFSNEDVESAEYSVDPLWLDGSDDIVLN